MPETDTEQATGWQAADWEPDAAEPGPDPAEVAAAIERAEDIENTNKLQLARERDLIAAGQRAADDARDAGHEDGYTRAQLDYKAAQHGVVTDLRQHLATWDGLRSRFAEPRDGDYPGGQAGLDRVARSWREADREAEPG